MSEIFTAATRNDPLEEAQPQSAKGTREVTLITGASGGIGADLARVFAKNCHDLALVARGQDKLEALANEIAAAGRPRPLVFALDMTGPAAVTKLAGLLDAEGATVDILVNNAGFGLAGLAADLDPAGQLAIIDLNIRVAVETTLHFLPQLQKARGKILNVASIAAYFPGGPRMAAYYASKSFILSFSLALAQELRPQGITVSALCPGYTKTDFQARAGIGPDMALSRFPGTTAVQVAEAGYAGLMAGRREIVPGFLNKVSVSVLPLLPKTFILPVISLLQQSRAART